MAIFYRDQPERFGYGQLQPRSGTIRLIPDIKRRRPVSTDNYLM
jgi:hypothetical protein